MNIPTHRLGLPPDAALARDFIEALVARYPSQIKLICFSSGFSLLQRGFKNQILATLRSRLAPSLIIANPLVNQLSDEIGAREDKWDINGICASSFLLSNAKRLSHACPNPVGVAAA